MNNHLIADLIERAISSAEAEVAEHSENVKSLDEYILQLKVIETKDEK